MTGPKVPLRARFLNKIRRLYRGGALEAFIARKGRSSGSPLWRSLTPGHNLYEPDAIRTFAHDGLEWNVDVSDYIGHGVYFGLDRTTERLFSLAEPDFITFDVGANIGWTALNLARRCPAGQVIAFEPDTRNHRKLVENVRLNSLANLSVERLGLADHPSRSRMIVENERNSGGNRISDDPAGTIELTTIDDYCSAKQIPRLDLLKIDTEGFEERIVRGGIDRLRQDRPIIYVEVNSDHLHRYGSTVSSLINLLREIGYPHFEIAETGEVVEDPLNLTGRHVDLIVR